MERLWTHCVTESCAAEAVQLLAVLSVGLDCELAIAA
jgi:hypothetical protein